MFNLKKIKTTPLYRELLAVIVATLEPYSIEILLFKRKQLESRISSWRYSLIAFQMN